MGGKRPAPAALPPGNTRYLLHRRLCGPQDRYGRVRNFSPTHEFDPRTVQPSASRYTDYAERFNMYITLFGLCYFVLWVS
jgi:hypothetical protein